MTPSLTRGEKIRKAAIRRSRSLAETHPNIAGQWHPTKNEDLTADDVTSGSGGKVWWLCETGHEWEATVSGRTKGGTGCPECFAKTRGERIRRAAIRKGGSLAETHPRIANQLHPAKNGDLTPHDLTYGSRRKIWWFCEAGHEWEARVINRTKARGTACPAAPSCPFLVKCFAKTRGEKIRKAAIRKKVGLAETHPDIARQLHPAKNGDLTPNDLTYGSGRKVWWFCEAGHEWEARVINRTKARGTACPECFAKTHGEKIRKAAIRRSGSLAETHPNIAGQWHPTKNEDLTADDVTSGSNGKVWWLCETGHEWEARVSNRTKTQGTGCPKCGIKSVGDKD